ncbi:MAG TPA: threonine--tRNA ligase [Firmicutes bacterium]|nr:threonine--tRNA ligase [Bacillota bacterium]
MTIIVKDIGTVDVEKGKDLLSIAYELGFKDALSALVNAQPKDLSHIPQDGDAVEFVTFKHGLGKEIYWHSTAHLMAYAVKNLHPDAILGIGPATDDGFYYDFLIDKPFSDDDLAGIEEEMRRILDEDHRFKRVELSKDEMRKLLTERGETLKVELLNDIEDEVISGYWLGEFFDLCRGPHLPSTSYIGAFKLLSVAGAYWRGDEERPMLSRIYGISFPTVEELERHLKLLEEAKRRDHRLIGRQMDLFSIEEKVGSGLVLWHPKGAVILDIIQRFWTDEHIKHGYQIVQTPHIMRDMLFKTSGHYDFYIDNMYTLNVEGTEYVLKPMNCPAHFLIYMSEIRSYRDLPIRYAEMGTVYRRERSGTLHGLLRVRGFTIDDAHIFCTPEQITEEVKKCLKFSVFFIETFGFTDYHFELSVRDPLNKDKYAGSDEEWERAEEALLKAAREVGCEPVRMEGEAVFYGPKLDLKLHDALGRIWQATTIQFDFNLPARFGAVYVDTDGERKEVVVIHRALLGSMERFMGTLIEHYGGDFPLWIAPVQARVLSVSDKFIKYARKVHDILKGDGIRSELDDRDARLQQKIRDAEVMKVPYMLIVGEKEEKEGLVSVRVRKRGNIGTVHLNKFIDNIKGEIESKSTPSMLKKE